MKEVWSDVLLFLVAPLATCIAARTAFELRIQSGGAF